MEVGQQSLAAPEATEHSPQRSVGIAEPAVRAEGRSLGAALRSTRVAVAAALIAAAIVNAAVAWQATRAVDSLRQRELELVRHARVLDAKAPELLSDGRGYLLTEDPHFLEDFAADRDEARATLARLRALIRSPEAAAMLDAVEVQLQGVITGVEERLELARQGDLEQARLRERRATDAQRELSERIDRLVEREENLLRMRVDELGRDRVVGLAVGTFLLALVGVLVSGLLSRGQRALEASQRRQWAAADELATLNATLEATNRDLRQAAEGRDRALADLKGTIRQREEFIASISHDLRNPLAAIKGRVQLLGRRASGPNAPNLEAIVEGLAGIDATTTRMAELIDQLVDAARLRMGAALDLDIRPTDLVSRVRQAVADQQQSTEHHHLFFEATEPAIVGPWDGARLERVLANLLGNAVKYSPDGGEIHVSVARQNGPTGDFAVITIRDQGLGIPAVDLPHVFERFHRAGNVAGRIQGTGLGLAGAQNIVEAHGGAISVESREGAGSTFTVRLPLGRA